MTVVKMASDNLFMNPNNVAIENLKLKVSDSGVVMEISAIDKYWVVKRKLNVYTPPPVGNKIPIGALEVWKQSMECFIDDLKWLLCLKYHIFWSNILYNPPCMDMLVSFLQEAVPPYFKVEQESETNELYKIAYKKIFIVFSRLITNKESEAEWMNKSHLGKILYDKYIFTIPILFDLCLLYGITNLSHTSTIIKSVFTVQPNYNDDLKKAIGFMKQMFTFVSLQVDNHSNMEAEPLLLPEVMKGFSKSFGGLCSKSNAKGNSLTLPEIYDLCLHLSDCALTVRLFMDVYSPSRQIFRHQDFQSSITNLYESTIPLIYKKVVELDDSTNETTNKIFECLDLIRAELIDAYRLILATTIDGLFDSGNVEANVNTYLTLVTDILSEKNFLKDYNSVYPIEVDLDVLCQAYDKMDPMKKNFILEAVMTNCYDDEPENMLINDREIPGTSNQCQYVDIHQTNGMPNAVIPEEAKTQSLISEVKDILPHLGDGFILKCLEHYNFNCERVINSVLEGSLDEKLQSLDPSLPIIPDDPLDVQYLKTGIERLNVFDNDEFDIMTRDKIDKSRVHQGKKKFEHKNLTEMLNDKSHLKEFKHKYEKFTLISDDVDIYDDEYDDTYDFEGPELVTDSTADDDKRFYNRGKNQRNEDIQESEDEDKDEPSSSTSNQTPADSFCVNPEEVRARYQARREMKYGHKPDRDVVGKAKGQGQEKEILLNRRKKEAGKSSRGNHNRRGASQWKRSQGMLPS